MKIFENYEEAQAEAQAKNENVWRHDAGHFAVASATEMDNHAADTGDMAWTQLVERGVDEAREAELKRLYAEYLYYRQAMAEYNDAGAYEYNCNAAEVVWWKYTQLLRQGEEK